MLIHGVTAAESITGVPSVRLAVVRECSMHPRCEWGLSVRFEDSGGESFRVAAMVGGKQRLEAREGRLVDERRMREAASMLVDECESLIWRTPG